MCPGRNPILIVQQTLAAKPAQEEVDLLARIQRLIHIAEDKVVVGICCIQPILPSDSPTAPVPHTVCMFRIGTYSIHTDLQHRAITMPRA
jgi:hypothetical protein